MEMKLSSRKELLKEASQEMKNISGKSKKIQDPMDTNEAMYESYSTSALIKKLATMDPSSKPFLKQLIQVLQSMASDIRSRAYGS
jgi:hypothetical protein